MPQRARAFGSKYCRITFGTRSLAITGAIRQQTTRHHVANTSLPQHTSREYRRSFPQHDERF